MKMSESDIKAGVRIKAGNLRGCIVHVREESVYVLWKNKLIADCYNKLTVCASCSLDEKQNYWTGGKRMRIKT